MGSNVLNTMFGFDDAPPCTHSTERASKQESAAWSESRFGDEQIRCLVHQVFFPGGAKSPHQVVFSGADRGSNVAGLCLQVGHSLAAQVSGSVCIVEVASPRTPTVTHLETESRTYKRERYTSLREAALFLSHKLWLLPSDIFMGNEDGLSAAWLRGRLDELRLDFDYTIFQAPSAGEFTDAPLLGHLCDGIILVLTANSTRRVAARKIKDRLFSANARLLGTVLSDRKFPIPERLYRRL